MFCLPFEWFKLKYFDCMEIFALVLCVCGGGENVSRDQLLSVVAAAHTELVKCKSKKNHRTRFYLCIYLFNIFLCNYLFVFGFLRDIYMT